VNKKRDDKYSSYRQIGILTTIPILMMVAPLLGLWIGRFLDKKLGTTDLWWIFLILGFIAAGKGVYDLIKRASQEK
jgi:F0F1-type ATP synthase assembly protein I